MNGRRGGNCNLCFTSPKCQNHSSNQHMPDLISGPALMCRSYSTCLLTDAKTVSGRLGTYPANQSEERIPDSNFAANSGFFSPSQIPFYLQSVLQMSEQRASGSAWTSWPGCFAVQGVARVVLTSRVPR